MDNASSGARIRMGSSRSRLTSPIPPITNASSPARARAAFRTRGASAPQRGQEDHAPSFKYAVYRQTVTHALDVEGYSFDQLVARAGDARVIKAQMLAAIAPRH